MNTDQSFYGNELRDSLIAMGVDSGSYSARGVSYKFEVLDAKKYVTHHVTVSDVNGVITYHVREAGKVRVMTTTDHAEALRLCLLFPETTGKLSADKNEVIAGAALPEEQDADYILRKSAEKVTGFKIVLAIDYYRAHDEFTNKGDNDPHLVGCSFYLSNDALSGFAITKTGKVRQIWGYSIQQAQATACALNKIEIK